MSRLDDRQAGLGPITLVDARSSWFRDFDADEVEDEDEDVDVDVDVEGALDDDPILRLARGSAPVPCAPGADTQVFAALSATADPRRHDTVIRLERHGYEATMVSPVGPSSTQVREAPPKTADRRVLGDYEVVRRIAAGGMGIVYEGRHLRLGRRVAIKCIKKALLDRPELSGRFLREAVAGAKVGHPGVVEVLDYGQEEDGSAYLVMEYLEGECLSRRMAPDRPDLGVAEVIQFGMQIAETVGAAHQAGIVHRDLKPENIFLVPDRLAPGVVRLKIGDFGVAKLVRDQAGSDPFQTAIGRLLGTPFYMAPEQCSGSAHQVDARCDIYGLGCVLYQLLAGRVPFRGGLGEVLAGHLYESPTPPSALNPEIPETLERLVLEMMAKSPDDRPQTMAEVERRLAGILDRDLDSAAPPPQPGEPGRRGRSGLAPTITRRRDRGRGVVARRRLAWALALLVAFLAGGLAGGLVSGRIGGEGGALAAPSASPSVGEASPPSRLSPRP